MLNKYDFNDSIPYSFKYSSRDSHILDIVSNIWDNMEMDKTKKVSLKKECLLATLINLRIGWLTCNYVRYSRTKEHYAKYPYRYKQEYYTYKIMCNIISGLESLGLVDQSVGFKNPTDGFATLTKMKATGKLVSLLQTVTNTMIVDIPPPELVVLKERGSGGIKINYKETDKTKQVRSDLIKYNTLRQTGKLALTSIGDIELKPKHKEFLSRFALSDDCSREIPLSNPYIYRVFSGGFDKGGRYYNGIESNMPKDFRTRLMINGVQTVEKDFSCLHINFIYNQRGLRLTTDAYSKLSNGDPQLRSIYKLVGLISINAGSLKSAFKALRMELVKTKLNVVLPDLTDVTLTKLFENWCKAHKKISDAFFTDAGIRLQYLDSLIAEKVIKHFTDKGVIVLVVHDSFIIQDKYESELVDVMCKEYKKLFKFNIKIN